VHLPLVREVMVHVVVGDVRGNPGEDERPRGIGIDASTVGCGRCGGASSRWVVPWSFTAVFGGCSGGRGAVLVPVVVFVA